MNRASRKDKGGSTEDCKRLHEAKDAWDKAKKKPVNISISETSDPTGAWNTYPVPAPKGRDGGGIEANGEPPP